MNIAILAAGAGGMYCGSCMRDNALASALKRLGHDVTLIPLYTPLRTEADDASDSEIFYGGINVYLQHTTGLFRRTPRMVDWLFDRPWLLSAAEASAPKPRLKKLAGLTATIVEGDRGNARKELRRLIEFLKDHVRPRIVSLPNLMFIGMADAFRRALNVPVVCELTGEDVFLDAMAPRDRAHLQNIIRAQAAAVSRFVSTTHYYAGRMAEYLDIPRQNIAVVPTGVSKTYLTPPAPRKASRGSSLPGNSGGGASGGVGYMARICPEKGLDRLVDAMLLLREKPGFANVRLTAAGYLGRRDQAWFNALRRRVAATPLRDAFTFMGQVSLPDKIAMLDSLDVLSVPTAYPEAKGIYVLEALARGVPVVQPAHGSFPELIAETAGGILVPPGDAPALADALAGLLSDPSRRRRLGEAGRAAIESKFTEEQMAAGMVRLYEALV